MNLEDTICALSSPQGMGAIAVIRLSGPEALAILDRLFQPASARHSLGQAEAYRMLFGKIVDAGRSLDEVMVALYRAPHSYTGQDVVEINCHGSVFIQDQLIRLLLRHGARPAEAGEFTLRAYLAGKMDLSQAEAVADLIASENAASHQVALQQMRGGFSQEIRDLRAQLIHFTAMIELELDFGEEEVEFADRAQLTQLLEAIKAVLLRLLESYDTGNVIKNGVPVAIVGAPNAGKSTLLNALLKEERAIVTEVAGTTRDAIEGQIHLGGLSYRFIDTAGIRATEDLVESLGIQKTFEKIDQSAVVLYLFDASEERFAQNASLIREEYERLKARCGEKPLLTVAHKSDLAQREQVQAALPDLDLLFMSGLRGEGLEALTARLRALYDLQSLQSNQSIVTNARHYEALRQSLEDIQQVEAALASGLSGELLSLDIRQALKHLGSIIGEVDLDRDILGAIFGKFCIGK